MIHISRLCLVDRTPPSPYVPPSSSYLSISQIKHQPMYVLLGDAGMGKTKEFQNEVNELGSLACLASAYDLATLDANEVKSWHGRVLFIDGFEEVQICDSGPERALDRIRNNLKKLGRPTVRISCRTDAWLDGYTEMFFSVSKTNSAKVLHLCEFSFSHCVQYLTNKGMHESRAREFLAKAERLNSGALTRNPQSLELLHEVYANSGWPSSESQLYERYCELALGDQMMENGASYTELDINASLDDAAYLCAVLVLGRRRGFARSPNLNESGYINVHDIELPQERIYTAINSKLFQRVSLTNELGGESECFVPAHRRLRDFLAGRYLAQQVNRGCSSKRILNALVSNEKNKAIEYFQATLSWTMCLIEDRSDSTTVELLSHEPLAMSLNADLSMLKESEKVALLKALIENPAVLKRVRQKPRRIACLIETMSLKELQNALQLKAGMSSTESDRASTMLMLLSHLEPKPALEPNLLNLVKNSQLHRYTRTAALKLLIHHEKGVLKTEILIQLLEDITAGHLPDERNGLLGRLLSALFPHGLKENIWTYFDRLCTFHDYSYELFWIEELPVLASIHECVHDTLNTCVQHQSNLVPDASYTLSKCIAKLLTRGLESNGDRVNPQVTYSWLDLSVKVGVSAKSSKREIEAIRGWLNQRQNLLKELIEIGLDQQEDSEYAINIVIERFHDAEVSKALCLFLIEQAKQRRKQAPLTAYSIFQYISDYGWKYVDLNDFQDLLEHNERVIELLPSPVNEESEHKFVQRGIAIQRKNKLEYDELKSKGTELLTNESSPRLLHGLAQTHSNYLLDFSPGRGRDRVLELVMGDTELTEVICNAFKNVLSHKLIPDANELLRLHSRSYSSLLTLPMLVGLSLLDEEGSTEYSDWSHEDARNALVAYFTTYHSVYQPKWFEYLLANQPMLFTNVLVEAIKALPDPFAPHYRLLLGFWELTHLPQYKPVAKQATLPIIKMFPLMANQEDLLTLEYLLYGALLYTNREELLHVIDNRLTSKSMPPRQRAKWLAVACAINTRKYQKLTEKFLSEGRNQLRVVHFAEFFLGDTFDYVLYTDQSVDLCKLLIKTIGGDYGPHPGLGFRWPPSPQIESITYQCIEHLKSDQSSESEECLKELSQDERLEKWWKRLTDASRIQRLRAESHHRTRLTTTQVTKLVKDLSTVS